jgi:hypothetical protein
MEITMSSNPNYNPQSNKLQGFTYGAGLKQPQYRQRPDRPDPVSGKPGGAGANYWSELDNTSKNPKEVGEDAKERVASMLGKEPPPQYQSDPWDERQFRTQELRKQRKQEAEGAEDTSDNGKTFPEPPERPSSKNNAQDAQDITKARGTFNRKQ